MKSLIPAIFFAFSFGAQAEDCLSSFNEKLLFSEILEGKQIHSSIKSGYLVEGEHEPELKITNKSKTEIIKVLKFQYRNAKTLGAEKLIEKNNDSISVTYRGPNSGYNIEYVFRKTSGCWYLAEFINWST